MAAKVPSGEVRCLAQRYTIPAKLVTRIRSTSNTACEGKFNPTLFCRTALATQCQVRRDLRRCPGRGVYRYEIGDDRSVSDARTIDAPERGWLSHDFCTS